MWSDNETKDDLFGFRVHAELIRELIIDPSVLPVTIGVFGDWGGGKSSIMEMLKEDFETLSQHGGIDTKKYEKVVVLHFNGWLFEGYDDAKSALLASILTSLRENKKFGPKVAGLLTELIRKVDVMRGARMLFGGAVAGASAAAVGASGGAVLLPAMFAGMFAGGREKAQDAVNASVEGTETKSENEVVPDLRQFRADFAAMLEASEIETLVILIDDLDRCSPERIIENLEAIKLFLNVPRTAFVIGADRRIIRHAVTWRYRDALERIASDTAADGGTDNAARIIDDYLEKLIQIPYTLPRLSPAEIETYLTLLFCRRHLGNSEAYKLCDSHCRTLRRVNRFRAFGLADVLEVLKDKKAPDELKESLRIGAGIASQITDVLQGNPRQVKRFLNAYFLRRKLAAVAGLSHINDEVLVKLMLLEYTSWSLFGKLVKSIDNDTGRATLLADLEPPADEKSKKQKPELPAEWKHLSRWLELKPMLSAVDLKDYVWVTRDRLGSTLSEVTLIPPVVRTILAQVLGGKFEQKSGLAEIPKLQGHERLILAQQLCAHAQRDPGDMKAYTALFDCMTVDPATIDLGVRLFSRISSGDFPAALGIRCNMLLKAGGAVAAAMEPVLKVHRGTDSFFGNALKQKV